MCRREACSIFGSLASVLLPEEGRDLVTNKFY